MTQPWGDRLSPKTRRLISAILFIVALAFLAAATACDQWVSVHHFSTSI